MRETENRNAHVHNVIDAYERIVENINKNEERAATIKKKEDINALLINQVHFNNLQT